MSVVLPAFSAHAQPHPHDPRIWYTDVPADLALAEHAEIKAVIFRRDLTARFREAVAGMARREAAAKPLGLLKIARGDLKTIIGRQHRHHQIDARLGTHAATGPDGHNMHIDGSRRRSSPRMRLICALEGEGTHFYAGPLSHRCKMELSKTSYASAKTLGKQEGVIDSVPVGAVMVFKAGSDVHDDFDKLLLHRPPLRSAAPRFAYVVDYDPGAIRFRAPA